MKTKYVCFILIAISVMLYACSQDGLQGPEGVKGEQGPVGAAGKDGSVLYSGSGIPNATLGKFGDYYLNKDNGDFYGPKADTGWGTAVSLKGANGTNGSNGTNGTNGADGSKIFSGEGIPSATLGINGDYYLDRLNYQLYGPKTNDFGWGIPILLRGAQGAQGPAGPPGADGTVIYSGNSVPDPVLGKAGDFYFDKTNILMYGPKTLTGGWGTGVSLKGTDGTNGTNGTNGTDGKTILNGQGVPSPALGNVGDFYINTLTYDIYGPKTLTGGWGNATSLKSPASGGSVIALETPDIATFSWDYETASTSNLKKRVGPLNSDSTSYYTIPSAYLETVKHGVVLVYLGVDAGGGTTQWHQLNYSHVEPGSSIFYRYILNIGSTSAYIRILSYMEFNSTIAMLNVKKVRIVITPAGTPETLSFNPENVPYTSTLKLFNLSDKDFKSL